MASQRVRVAVKWIETSVLRYKEIKKCPFKENWLWPSGVVNNSDDCVNFISRDRNIWLKPWH